MITRQSIHRLRSLPRGQRGAALMISLMLLLALTVITLVAARSAGLEFLIATNAQHSTLALAEAEESVLVGEQDIQTNHTAGGPAFDFAADDTDGFYALGTVDVENVDWSGIATEQVVNGGGEVTDEYVVEYLGTAPAAGGTLAVGAGGGSTTRHLYRITGRGVSARGATRLVQTIYATE